MDASWTRSEGSFSSIELVLPEQTVTDADYDFSQIHTYSDLDYTTLEFHASGSRQIREATSLTLGVGVIDLDDDASWVYGNLSGSVVYTRAGLETSF
ncbi:hypothetical protein K8I85_19170 [bacterium]|nr:hypothetical protein [bacterium]